MSLKVFYAKAEAKVQPIPFRLRVLKGLTAVMERVNPDNGFHHDLRGKVFRGRIRYDQNDPIPMVSILEAAIPQETNGSGGGSTGSTGEWELLIQGFAEDDRLNPTDPAHHLMAEVKAVFAQDKQKDNGHNIAGMGGRVMAMSIGQGTVRPAEDPTTEAFFWLTLTLRVGELLDQPYN